MLVSALKKKIFLVVFFFILGFFGNNFTLSKENSQKCFELIKPNNLEDLKKLRTCIAKIKTEKEIEKENLIIISSHEGSTNLTERIINRENPSKVLSK